MIIRRVLRYKGTFA